MILQVLRSGGGVFIADLLGKAFGFMLISGLTFILSPNDLGKYNAVFTAAMSLYTFSGWGVPIVLQRQSALDEHKDKVLLGEWISSGIVIMASSMLILIIILLLLSESVWSVIFPGLDMKLLFWVPLLTLGYFLVQSPLSILLGLGRFKTYAVRSATEAAITLACVILGASQWGLEGAIVGLFIALCINTIVTFVILRRVFIIERIVLSIRKLRTRALTMLGEGSYYFIGNTMMGVIANFVMISLLAKHAGYADFGFLRVAMSLAAILAVIPNAAKTVTITYVAKFKAASTYMKSLQIRYLFFALVVTTGIMSLILEPVVSLLFGDKYIDGVPVYRAILYLNIVFNVHQILNGFIVGHGLLRYSGIVSTIVVLVFILLMGTTIPMIGLEGYYLAFGTGYLVGLLVLMQREVTTKNYPDAIRLKRILLVVVGIVLCLLLVSQLPINTWERAILEFGILVVYSIGHIRYAFPIEEIKKIWTSLRVQLKLS